MWETTSRTEFKQRYYLFNYSKLSWNAEGCTLCTIFFDLRPNATSFNCRFQLIPALKQKEIIVVIDKTWVKSHQPEMKRPATEWHMPNSPRQAKFWREQNIKDTYDICLWYPRCSHQPQSRDWPNCEWHVLQGLYLKGLRPGYRRKRPELLAAKQVREKSRECHNHKPQPFPEPKRKRKPTNQTKNKSNKRPKKH